LASPQRLIFEGPEDRLMLKKHATAILAVAIAACRLLESQWSDSGVRRRHSVGEYSANVAAALLRLATRFESCGARPLQCRKRFRRDGCDGGDSCLDAARVAQACPESAVAKSSARQSQWRPGQIVIAGARDAVQRAGERAKGSAPNGSCAAGSAPFHCAVDEAAERVSPGARALSRRTLASPVVANVAAEPKRDAAAGESRRLSSGSRQSDGKRSSGACV